MISFLVGLRANKEDLSQLKEVFKQLDPEHTGYVERSEIEPIVSHLRSQLATINAEFDDE